MALGIGLFLAPNYFLHGKDLLSSFLTVLGMTLSVSFFPALKDMSRVYGSRFVANVLEVVLAFVPFTFTLIFLMFTFSKWPSIGGRLVFASIACSCGYCTYRLILAIRKAVRPTAGSAS